MTLVEILRFLRQALIEKEIVISIPPQEIPSEWKPDGSICHSLSSSGLTAISDTNLPGTAGVRCLGTSCSDYFGCTMDRADSIRKLRRLIKDSEDENP
jgi:hypothetical protein